MKKILFGFFIPLLFVTVLTACGKDAKKEITNSIPAKEIEEIYVTADNQTVNVITTTSNEVKITITSGEKPEIAVKENSLYIDAEASSKVVNFHTPELKVELPEKIYEKIKIETISGKIILKAKSIVRNIQTDSADVTIQLLAKPDDMNISLKAATGKIESAFTAHLVVQEKGGGNIVEHLSEHAKMKIEAATSSGNIYLVQTD